MIDRWGFDLSWSVLPWGVTGVLVPLTAGAFFLLASYQESTTLMSDRLQSSKTFLITYPATACKLTSIVVII